MQPAICTILAALLACLAGPAASAQPARLELRLVAQSGLPGIPNLRPTGCVFDDPPGIVAITAGAARRFEVQARVVDTDPADGLDVGGVVSFNFQLISSRAGFWARALLANAETVPAADPPPFNVGVDCSGASLWRGMHAAFRAWDYQPGVPHNDDARNGTITANGLSGLHAEAIDALAASRWIALYSFEFMLPPSLTGDVGLSVRIEPVNNIAFVWTSTTGQVFDGSAWTGAGLLLRAPAGAFACCANNNCYIALTPSACFANAGHAAIGAVCQAASCCAADFNANGAVTVQDVFDFVDAYLGFDPRADVDHNERLSPQDVFAFLEVWFRGCPT